MNDRTSAYWPTRILFAVVAVTAVATAAFAFGVCFVGIWGFGEDDPLVAGLPTHVWFGLVATGLPLAGLAWLIRLYRGSDDAPPAWRYRDR